MKAKSSAHYQREYRKRLREAGLVKKEVWIRPEHATQLASIESTLRLPGGLDATRGERTMSGTSEGWTTDKLYQEIQKVPAVGDARMSLELIDGVDPTLHFTLHDFGDLPVFLTVSGDQIIAEAVLWSVDEVNDVNAFNEAVLRTHKYFPLSTISLDSVPGGADYYYMFGALSSKSSLDNVVAEIETLGSNVIQATEAYAEFISLPVAVN